MNTKKTFIAAVMAVALLPNLSVAQFPKLPSLGGGSSSSGDSGGGDAVAQQDQLVKAYVEADKDVLKAQAKMADAVGLKERAAKLNAAGDALGAGATKDSLQASETEQSEASKEIQAKLKDGNLQMDEAGKKKFADALGNLGRGVSKYAKLKSNIAAFQSAITGGGAAGALAAATKLGVGKFIVTSAPSNLRNVSSTLSTAVSFAKSHDIPVPADATAAI
jgi:hypothetical protein